MLLHSNLERQTLAMSCAKAMTMLILSGLAALGLYVQAHSAEPTAFDSQLHVFTLSMPQLNRDKQIWLYLPPNYDLDHGQRFPVIYMQDGQYLFDPLLRFSDNHYIDQSLHHQLQHRQHWFGSWQVDKHIDQLVANKQTLGFIVVGVSSEDGNRTAEYSPWPWAAVFQPQAEHYLAFLITTVKPFVDQHYRTLRDRAHTAIAGSSMGGLLALYAGLQYPDVFSKVAALSPVLAEHVSGQPLLAHIQQKTKTHTLRIYVDLGTRELSFGPIQPVYDTLRSIGFSERELWFRHIPEGEHRITDWSVRFSQVLLWLYDDESN